MKLAYNEAVRDIREQWQSGKARVSRRLKIPTTHPIKLWLLALLVASTLLGWPVKAEPKSPTLATLVVHVTDAQTRDPIFQASLTLRFRQPRSRWKLKRTKPVSYSAKTDKKGLCKFPYVPEGSVELMVTAPQHEAFGRSFQFMKNDQVIEVKLRRPRPQL